MSTKSKSKPKLDLRALPPAALLSIREGARYLHVSPTKLYSLINAGRVEVRHLDGRPRIAVSALEAFSAGLVEENSSAPRFLSDLQTSPDTEDLGGYLRG
jgi:Helix-turn-helix domain